MRPQRIHLIPNDWSHLEVELNHLTKWISSQEVTPLSSPTFIGLTLTGLTAGRIPVVTTGGLIADSPYFLWDNDYGELHLKSTTAIYFGEDSESLIYHNGYYMRIIDDASIHLDAPAIVTAGTLSAGAITGTSFIIGANTLGTTEWANLDGQDQTVKTTSSPTFAGLTVSGVGTINTIDMPEIATPAVPVANKLRLYAAEDTDFTFLESITDLGLVSRFQQDTFRVARNTSGASIAKGKVVYFTGSTGNKPNFALAKANSETTMTAIAMTTAAVDNNNFGQLMLIGRLTGVNTNAWSEGDELWVDATTAGELTNVRPLHPNLAQWVGTVEVKSATVGVILVNIQSLTGIEDGTNRNTYTIGDTTAGNKVLKFDGATDATITWDGTKFDFGTAPLLTTGTLGAGAVTGTSFIIGANTISSFTNLASLAGLSFAATSFVKMTAAGTFGLDTTTYQATDLGLTAILGLSKADGNFIVGAGSTWVAESGNTARTSLGLGTANTVSFAGLSVTSLEQANPRLVASNATGTLLNVPNLSTWVTGTTNRITVADDGDGTVTLSAPQDLHTTATPSFATLSLSSQLKILESGATPTKYTIFQGGDQTVDITYTLPTALGAAGTVLTDAAGNGVLSWAAGGGGTSDHAALTHLAYADSGHTGFQATHTSLTDIVGLAVTDGNIIVGDGTNWVAESGATARTSLGLGTTDSPTFANVYVPDDGIVGISGGARIVFDSTNNNLTGVAHEFIVGDSSSVTPTKKHLYWGSANAHVDLGGLGYNNYYNGSSWVRDNTSFTGWRLGVNTGDNNAFSTFALTFTNTSGTSYDIFYTSHSSTSADWLIQPQGYGKVAIGLTAATAKLHLAGCTAAANTASLKIDAGTLATTPVSGNIESDGTHLYWTNSGGTRKQLDN